MEKRTKSQYYDFVFNNYTEESLSHLKKCSENKIFLSFICGKEIGTSGTIHLQGYLKLDKRQYKSYLLNSCLNEGILKDKLSFRIARNVKALVEYVQKDGCIVINKNDGIIPTKKTKLEDHIDKCLKELHEHESSHCKVVYEQDRNNGDHNSMMIEMKNCKFCNLV